MGFEGHEYLHDFCVQAGWGDADVQPLQPDASTRRYFRLHRNGETRILMHAPSSAESGLCPPDADVSARIALGYNALARLAANDCTAFAGLASDLVARGFSAPQIHDHDLSRGLLLIEDLDGSLFFDHVQKFPDDEGQLYAAAVQVLAALARSTFGHQAEFAGRQWPLQAYDETALLAETELLTQWYLPWKTGREDTDLAAKLAQAWSQALQKVLASPDVLVLRDFHAQNLIWLPQRFGIANVGLLDFQDAVLGHPAYDLVSLLQDARRDVSPALHEPLIEQFISAAMIRDEADFRQAYAVLGAQRAAKILGIFVRLAKRDGKPHYLELLPRIEHWFAHNLAQKGLEKLRDLAMAAGLMGDAA